ncbi:SHOCT domain-containing protein [Streptacidiphilus sp. PB12-B1b]|uniref:SHOCT domain-containing protein n=1 Tax=Streptacidiphilus sp. PB12-B1b TaxID=2705012 RepID=UPI0015FCE387|nr:SHOCT domain-containing protein [Streptacidiphilus sp. PB12-B1b]QMU77038.1 SHOCT domain-containing protein [Streptacidiphilus sp. PB12-B1b]
MTNYPLLDIFWTMLELFLWILWFFLLFKVLADIFRSHDMSGWGKAGWIVLVIILPFLGVLLYVIFRGRSMGQRDLEQAQKADAAFKQYVRDAAGPSAAGAAGHVDELARLADLKASGAITEQEFQRAKDKLLN